MALSSSSKAAASANPNSGESSNASPTSLALPQSTPAVPSRPCMMAFITPTPMIEPISVCELDAGRPNAEVPRFQMMAAINSANTMAKPALLPTWRINSTGNNEIMPKATAPEDVSTPSRLNRPDQTTAEFAANDG